ncbi:hypothetical protein GCM10010254_17430 [Streptomyces chromofuscus]|nr:hypothetical protein GCM10010254_17430 [Streptomyces chromofuscus]
MLGAAAPPREAGRGLSPRQGPGRRRRVRGATTAPKGYLTRPYHTLFVQIFCSLTTSPVFGACQIFPLPA